MPGVRVPSLRPNKKDALCIFFVCLSESPKTFSGTVRGCEAEDASGGSLLGYKTIHRIVLLTPRFHSDQDGVSQKISGNQEGVKVKVKEKLHLLLQLTMVFFLALYFFWGHVI